MRTDGYSDLAHTWQLVLSTGHSWSILDRMAVSETILGMSFMHLFQLLAPFILQSVEDRDRVARSVSPFHAWLGRKEEERPCPELHARRWRDGLSVRLGCTEPRR